MAQHYGPWRIVRSLDEGGQAFTFLAENRDSATGELFVLKRLKNNRVDRAERELRAIQQIEHPNIVRLVDHDLASEKPYIVTEYCSGGTLQDLDLSAYSEIDRLRIFSAV